MDARRLAALELAHGAEPTAAAIDRVANATSPEAARWAFTQWALRNRARAKFTRADTMLFDREGLEMATHEAVAAYHASCFPSGVRIADLACGIGGDLVALSKRGPVVGFEQDPERAAMARHNLKAHGAEGEIEVADALGANGFDYVFADPARRSSGRRSLSPEDFSPSPQAVVERFGNAKLLGIKLSPLLPDAWLESLADGRPYRLEFVSFGRECREALIWMGTYIAASEAGESDRFAVHVESGQRLAASDPPEVVDAPLGWVFEADPAAIRAHALDAFGLSGLGDAPGYLTGDFPVASVWLRGYSVVSPPLADVREVNRVLRGLGAGTPEVKQRGTAIDPATLARQLKGKGRPLVVIAYASQKRVRYIVAEPHGG